MTSSCNWSLAQNALCSSDPLLLTQLRVSPGCSAQQPESAASLSPINVRLMTKAGCEVTQYRHMHSCPLFHLELLFNSELGIYTSPVTELFLYIFFRIYFHFYVCIFLNLQSLIFLAIIIFIRMKDFLWLAVRVLSKQAEQTALPDILSLY